MRVRILVLENDFSDSKKCWSAFCQLFPVPCRGQVQVMTKERECQHLIGQTHTVTCLPLALTVRAKATMFIKGI